MPLSKQETAMILLSKFLMKYRILRTIGRYFFSSIRWLRPIVHIDLYKDEVEKSRIPKKKSR